MNPSILSESSLSSRPFLLVWALYCLILVLGVLLLLFPSGLAEQMDFRQLYTGGLLARTDPANLYDYDRQKGLQDASVSKADGLLPFNHPAYEAAFIAPLTRLSYRKAYLCFLVFNASLLAPCFYLCRDVFSRPGTVAQPRPGLQLFAFFPTTIALLMGQDSVLFFLGSCFVLRYARVGKIFRSGVILGLVLFKPQIVVPLAILLTASYGRKLLAGFAVGGVLVIAASMVLTGWHGFVSFAGIILQTGSVGASQRLPAGSLGVFPNAMPNLRGLISALTMRLIPGKIVFGLIAGLSFCVIAWGIRNARKRPGSDTSFSLSLTSAVLVSYHLGIQDLLVMQIPLGLMGNSRNRSISNASLLFYVAPPLLAMLGHDAIFVMALPSALLLHGIMSRRS